MRRSFVSSLLALSLLAAGCGGSNAYTPRAVAAAFAREGVPLVSGFRFGPVAASLPPPRAVLGHVSLNGASVVVVVFASEGDAIQAETIATLVLPAGASTARRRNVLVVYEPASERLVQTALAQLR
jgi:hypothetical protein